MNGLLTVLIGAVLTAVVGNFLVQRWQMRNWREQQRVLAYQAQLNESGKLIEEVSAKCGDRHNAMRNLANAISSGTDLEFEAAVSAYKLQLDVWNTAINSFYVRTRIVSDHQWSLRFEADIHKPFFKTGQKIEQAIRLRRAGAGTSPRSTADITKELSIIQGSISNYLSEFTREYNIRRNEIINGVKIYYTNGHLSEYSTTDLLKAIFVADVDRLYVIRPS